MRGFITGLSCWLWALALLLQPEAAAAQAAAAAQTAVAVQGTAAPQGARLALLQPVEAPTVAFEVAHSVEDALLVALSRRPGLRVVSPAELQQAVAFSKTQAELGCDKVAECLAEVERKLRAEILVHAKLAPVGSQWLLTVGLVDVSKRVESRRVTRELNTLSGLSGVFPGLLAELFGDAGQAASAFRLKLDQPLRLAIWPLAPLGVPEATADSMTQILAAEYSQIQGVSVLGRDDIEVMLSQIQSAAELGYQEDVHKIVEVGSALGVSQLVTGKVARVGDSYVVSLRLIDVHATEVQNRVVEEFEGDAEELRHAIKVAGYNLLGVDTRARTGKVDLSFNVKRGRATLGSVAFPIQEYRVQAERLPPGRYPLWVVPEGKSFLPLHTDLYVPPGLENVRRLQLKEASTRWYKRWWVWALTGAAVAGATAAVYSYSPPNGAVALP
jgi:TolB-like protein